MTMHPNRAVGPTRIALLALLTLTTSVFSGCLDPLVGYPCAEGYTACGELCVNTSTATNHCGACGAVCSGVCRVGMCMLDGGADDAGDASDARPEAGGARDTVVDNARVDAPTDAPTDTDGAGGAGGMDMRPADVNVGADAAGGMGGSDAGAPPVDLRVDAPADVAVAVDVPADVPVVVDAPVVVDVPAPVDLPVEVAVDATPVTCDGGLSSCTGRCVNLTDDPDNCGACSTRCGSGLCTTGVCQQQGAGHVVVIGHDYVVNRTSMNNLLGNAVFLAAEDPIRVLAFEGEASPATIAGANQAIDDLAALRGRRWNRTTRTSGTIAAALPDFDVLLIYAQYGSSNATLASHGADWAMALTNFVNSGRTIVLLDGISPNNSGTYRILNAAGLFAATGHAAVTGETLTVFNPSDAIAARLPRTYRAEFTSVSFVSAETAKVVVTSMGAPVVVHKTY